MTFGDGGTAENCIAGMQIFQGCLPGSRGVAQDFFHQIIHYQMVAAVKDLLRPAGAEMRVTAGMRRSPAFSR